MTAGRDPTGAATREPAWRIALRPSVVRRGLLYAIVVGAVLVGINHGDALVEGEVTTGRLLKIGLTVLVPYCVSTLSSVAALRGR